MRLSGLLILALSCAVPAWMFATLPNVSDKIALFSQYLGSVALILMAWGMVMATRLPGVEALFGGMDRTYVLHKWAGIIAMVTMLVHDTVDAEMRGLGRETALVELGETLGEISLYGLLILVVISVATFIPYHLWRWTHKGMGAFFVAAAVHFALELRPFALMDPLGLVISGFCVMGTLAYAYTLLPLPMRRAHRYLISEVAQTGGATTLTLTPKGRGIRHHAGQFAVATFAGAGLSEPHPFTIASAPRADRSLRLSIKALGDFTTRLPKALTLGQEVQIQGPMGRFLRRGARRPEVWVAGGIGITPFLAWAEALGDQDTNPIHLFYCVRSRPGAPHLARIEALARSRENLTLHVMASGEGNRLGADLIAEIVDLSRAKVAYCGPEGLRHALQKGLRAHGVGPRDFHYEEFEFRTGIGLGALAKWVAGRAVHQVRART